MLIGAIHPLIAELLVVAAFTEKTRRAVPLSVEGGDTVAHSTTTLVEAELCVLCRCAFTGLRRVFSLIASHNWALKPFIVDVPGEWKGERADYGRQ